MATATMPATPVPVSPSPLPAMDALKEGSNLPILDFEWMKEKDMARMLAADVCEKNQDRTVKHLFKIDIHLSQESGKVQFTQDRIENVYYATRHGNIVAEKKEWTDDARYVRKRVQEGTHEILDEKFVSIPGMGVKLYRLVRWY